MGLLFVSTRSVHPQEPPAFEKIRDLSPDGKFALRVSYSSEPKDPNQVDSDLITASKLVSLPSKGIIVKVSGEGDPPRLIWSSDSKWVAFPVSEGHRLTETQVYHRSGEELTQVEAGNLRVDVEGDVRNEYIKPLRWIKPGVLLLEQFDIFRGGNAEDATYQFTAKFDEKSGKFQIGPKKKVPSKE